MSAERILLWRHGRTGHNHEGRFQGQLDAPLDDVGRQQVADAVEVLAGLVNAAPPVRIVSSDLSRASESAAALGVRLGVPVELDVALRETYSGRWEGLLTQEIMAAWPEDYAAWRRGEDVRIGGGESRSEVAARAAAAIERHDAVQDGGTLMVVSHGGALRGGTLQLLGLTPSAWPAMAALRNAHWAELRRRGSSWQLHSWNVGVPWWVEAEARGLEVVAEAPRSAEAPAPSPDGQAL